MVCADGGTLLRTLLDYFWFLPGIAVPSYPERIHALLVAQKISNTWEDGAEGIQNVSELSKHIFHFWNFFPQSRRITHLCLMLFQQYSQRGSSGAVTTYLHERLLSSDICFFWGRKLFVFISSLSVAGQYGELPRWPHSLLDRV